MEIREFRNHRRWERVKNSCKSVMMSFLLSWSSIVIWVTWNHVVEAWQTFVWFSSFCICFFNFSLFVSELFAPSTSELATKRVESLCVNRRKSTFALNTRKRTILYRKVLKLSQNQISFKNQLSTYLLFKTENIISPEWPKKVENLTSNSLNYHENQIAFETRCEPTTPISECGWKSENTEKLFQEISGNFFFFPWELASFGSFLASSKLETRNCATWARNSTQIRDFVLMMRLSLSSWLLFN